MPHSTATPSPSAQPLWIVAAVLLLALGLGGLDAARHVRKGLGVAAPAPARKPAPWAPLAPAGPAKATDTGIARDAATAGPSWESLSAAQHVALEPLAERWNQISAVQKRRWLALANNYPSLSPQEKDVLHSRMTDWASLSATQRSQARIAFARAQGLHPDDKRAQWEAYRALSDEERRMLADEASLSPVGAATAIRPVAPQKLAQIPAAATAPANRANPPKIPRESSEAPRIAAPAPTSLPVPAAEAGATAPPTAPPVEASAVNIPSAVPSALPPLAPTGASESPSNPVPPVPTADQSGLYPQ